jgi:lipoprotein-releasing system permease protein
MYKLFLALRYLRKRRITYFAVLSVALCVAMVVVVHGVMTGFLENVRSSSRRLLGDVILEIGSMTTFPYYDEFIDTLNEEMAGEIELATPVILNAGLATLLVDRDDKRAFPVQVNGIRLDEYRRVNAFGEGLYYESHFPGLSHLGPQAKPRWRRDEHDIARLPSEYEEALAASIDESTDLHPRPPDEDYRGPGIFDESKDGQPYSGVTCPGAILGNWLVMRDMHDGSTLRDVPRGTLVRLTVLPFSREGVVGSGLGQKLALRYVDDSNTRIYEIDSQSIYCDFETLQKSLDMHALTGANVRPGRATQIQVKLKPGVHLIQARARIAKLWEMFRIRMAEQCSPRDYDDMKYMVTRTWLERNAAFINAIEKQRYLVLILLGVISLVAVVLVGCTFYMIVQERTREIGIIKSMGASAGGIAGMFLTYGIVVGMTGAALGTLGGWFFVDHINEFQAFIAALHPKLQIWNARVYSFDRIPQVLRISDVAIVNIVAVASAVLGASVPAIRAARVWPARALRYE